MTDLNSPLLGEQNEETKSLDLNSVLKQNTHAQTSHSSVKGQNVKKEHNRFSCIRAAMRGDAYVTDVRQATASARELCAFVIVYHKNHGFLLLKSKKKKKKGEYYQLCGGHLDAHEILNRTVAEAAKMAAARELFEETGLDFRILPQINTNINKQKTYINKHKIDRLVSLEDCGICAPKRYFFELLIDDSDKLNVNSGIKKKKDNVSIAHPSSGQNFPLFLSSEHIECIFVQTVEEASLLTQKHSGGHCSLALGRYGALNAHKLSEAYNNYNNNYNNSSYNNEYNNNETIKLTQEVAISQPSNCCYSFKKCIRCICHYVSFGIVEKN